MTNQRNMRFFGLRLVLITSLALGLLFLMAGHSLCSTKKITLKYAFVASPQSPHLEGGRYFKSRVEELSGGRIEVQLYPSSQLGDKLQTLEGLRAGTVEMTSVAATDLSTYSDKWSVFSLPYLFESREHMFRVLRDERVKEILSRDAEAHGFKVLMYWGMGARSMINSRRPIYKPEDLKGLKIRIMQDPILAKSINAMGASGVPLAWSEVYTALHQKVIDGLEQSAPLYVDSKTYEVAKYFSLTEHFIIPDTELISLKFWNTLPKDLQDVLLKASEEAEREYFNIWDRHEANALEILKSSGVQINQVDKAPFKERVKPIYEEFSARIGADLIKVMQQIP